MTYIEYKNQKQNEFNNLPIFYAFSNEQLEKAYMESIETVRYTVEAKDTYTRGHSDRVSEYSVLIGKKLGL